MERSIADCPVMRCPDDSLNLLSPIKWIYCSHTHLIAMISKAILAVILYVREVFLGYRYHLGREQM